MSDRWLTKQLKFTTRHSSIWVEVDILFITKVEPRTSSKHKW